LSNSSINKKSVAFLVFFFETFAEFDAIVFLRINKDLSDFSVTDFPRGCLATIGGFYVSLPFRVVLLKFTPVGEEGKPRCYINF
jgi:hypothetical protein